MNNRESSWNFFFWTPTTLSTSGLTASSHGHCPGKTVKVSVVVLRVVVASGGFWQGPQGGEGSEAYRSHLGNLGVDRESWAPGPISMIDSYNLTGSIFFPTPPGKLPLYSLFPTGSLDQHPNFPSLR